MSSYCSSAKMIFSLLVAGTLAVLTACGSPSADAASKNTTAKAKPKTETPAAKAPAKAPDTKTDAGKAGTQFVANFNFKEWEGAVPRRWTAEPADKVAKVAGANANSVHVELKPSGSDKFTMLRQHLSGNLAGKAITVTLRAKASEAKMLSAKLTFETKNGPQTVVVDASGDGGWETVTRAVNVPADAKADSGMLAIVLRPAAKKPALVDYVTITAK